MEDIICGDFVDPQEVHFRLKLGQFGEQLIQAHFGRFVEVPKPLRGEPGQFGEDQAGELIEHYQPDVMVLEDTLVKPFRRALRIRTLTKQLILLGERHKIKVALLSREQVRQAFFAHGRGTKHALAGILAGKFPDELGFRLPPKRRPWMSEDYRMAIFDAVALALALRGSHRPNQNKNYCSPHN